MIMKQYSIGFVFNESHNEVLLIRKNKPECMRGKWNGVGGKIEGDENPLQAMTREGIEETGHTYDWQFKIILICPGGTVYVFATTESTEDIQFEQREDEELRCHYIHRLHEVITMNSIKYLIPLCLANLQFPITIISNDIT